MREGVPPLGAWERLIIAVSLVLAGFLVIDPLVLGVARGFDDETRAFFRRFTDLGKSGWILVPLGAAVLALYLFRTREFRFRMATAWGYLIQLAGFAFVAIAGASLTASLSKNIIGRARPKFFDTVGSVEFEPLTFNYDYASFPSGHAATICALAATLAIVWPRARVYLFTAAAWVAATRFLIGSHYLSDAAGGAALGFLFPYLLRERMATRRILFEKRPDGTIALRGRRLWPWLAGEARNTLLPHGDTMAQSG